MMLLLADIIFYGGIVILAILLLFMIMLIVCPILYDFWERKHPEKKSQRTNGTYKSQEATAYSDDMSDYRRKQQRLQQQMQWQQEVDRISQEAVRQAQDDAHTAMTVAERNYATAIDMFYVGNSMHEGAHSMASSAHDSFNDSFSAPSFDCGGSFGGNPFF